MEQGCSGGSGPSTDPAAGRDKRLLEAGARKILPGRWGRLLEKERAELHLARARSFRGCDWWVDRPSEGSDGGRLRWREDRSHHRARLNRDHGPLARSDAPGGAGWDCATARARTSARDEASFS